MQHRWILLSALLVLLSCQGQKAQRSLTLMTYNVGVFSKYEDNTTSDVAQLILDRSATLVALNELDSCNTRHSAYQLKELARRWGRIGLIILPAPFPIGKAPTAMVWCQKKPFRPPTSSPFPKGMALRLGVWPW